MSGPPVDGTPVRWFSHYPPDFFAFILIDECHRGGATNESNWRGILEHLAAAMQLGLTATPRRSENTDTYAYVSDPVFTDSLKEGITDAFLTPFRVKPFTTTLDEYIYTPDDTVVEGEIEAGRPYRECDFIQFIEIRQREEQRVRIFLSQIDQRQRQRTGQQLAARLSGQREDDPHHPHHALEARHRYGCPQCTQHRAAAA